RLGRHRPGRAATGGQRGTDLPAAAARSGAHRPRRIRLHLRTGQGQGAARRDRRGADLQRTDDMRALQAATELAKHRVDVAVVHTPTLKPFDTETVLAEVDSDRLVVTCENHTVVGGLFETVAAAAVRRGVHGTITPIALPDEFL